MKKKKTTYFSIHHLLKEIGNKMFENDPCTTRPLLTKLITNGKIWKESL